MLFVRLIEITFYSVLNVQLKDIMNSTTIIGPTSIVEVYINILYTEIEDFSSFSDNKWT